MENGLAPQRHITDARKVHAPSGTAEFAAIPGGAHRTAGEPRSSFVRGEYSHSHLCRQDRIMIMIALRSCVFLRILASSRIFQLRLFAIAEKEKRCKRSDGGSRLFIFSAVYGHWSAEKLCIQSLAASKCIRLTQSRSLAALRATFRRRCSLLLCIAAGSARVARRQDGILMFIESAKCINRRATGTAPAMRPSGEKDDGVTRAVGACAVKWKIPYHTQIIHGVSYQKDRQMQQL